MLSHVVSTWIMYICKSSVNLIIYHTSGVFIHFTYLLHNILETLAKMKPVILGRDWGARANGTSPDQVSVLRFWLKRLKLSSLQPLKPRYHGTGGADTSKWEWAGMISVGEKYWIWLDVVGRSSQWCFFLIYLGFCFSLRPRTSTEIRWLPMLATTRDWRDLQFDEWLMAQQKLAAQLQVLCAVWERTSSASPIQLLAGTPGNEGETLTFAMACVKCVRPWFSLVENLLWRMIWRRHQNPLEKGDWSFSKHF